MSIRWGDMDAYGHVNNVAYFRYFETVRMEWLHALARLPGHDPAKGPVMVNGSCDFLVPIVFPADIEIRMFLGMPGRSSLPTYYDIVGNGTRYADGASKLVWIVLATGRPTPLPEHIAAPLRKKLGGEGT
jgi:acyl-CoA thioester hydrolase